MEHRKIGRPHNDRVLYLSRSWSLVLRTLNNLARPTPATLRWPLRNSRVPHHAIESSRQNSDLFPILHSLKLGHECVG